MKDSATMKVKSSNNYVTVVLTREKMEAANVSVRETNNGDLHFELPQMCEEQQKQLNSVWERLHDDLTDVGIDHAIGGTAITAAAKTLVKETNARIIANLL